MHDATYTCTDAQATTARALDAQAASLASLRDATSALEAAMAAQPEVVERVRAEVKVVAKDVEQTGRSIAGAWVRARQPCDVTLLA